MGREGYSIIGQGKIDEILSTKSGDRREVFEEAAGISKYRHRKEESEHKLERTEENLVRINDKIAELELQVEPLREQAEKAKKYLVLRDELRSPGDLRVAGESGRPQSRRAAAAVGLPVRCGRTAGQGAGGTGCPIRRRGAVRRPDAGEGPGGGARPHPGGRTGRRDCRAGVRRCGAGLRHFPQARRISAQARAGAGGAGQPGPAACKTDRRAGGPGGGDRRPAAPRWAPSWRS
jgi:hypothetical protein